MPQYVNKGPATHEKNKGRKRRRRKAGFFYWLLTIVITAGAISIAFTVFFKLTRFEVNGNDKYTMDDIIRASGIEEGSNLFLVDKFKAMRAIMDSLPYIDEVQISRIPPNTMVIDVSECAPAAGIVAGEHVWIINDKCKLLESVAIAPSYLARVVGVELLGPVAGDRAWLGEREQDKIETVSELLAALEAYEILGEVAVIDASVLHEIRFSFDGRFTVVYGLPGDIDLKTRFLVGIVDKLQSNDRGTIDIGVDNTARFIPEKGNGEIPIPEEGVE